MKKYFINDLIIFENYEGRMREVTRQNQNQTDQNKIYLSPFATLRRPSPPPTWENYGPTSNCVCFCIIMIKLVAATLPLFQHAIQNYF